MKSSSYGIIDSFPLPVCHFGRAHYCRSFRGDGAEYGVCASKKETYYGYKVHAIVTLEGFITSFELSPASIDETVFSQLTKQLHIKRVLAKSFQGLCTRLVNKILACNLCLVINYLFDEHCEIGKIKNLIFQIKNQ